MTQSQSQNQQGQSQSQSTPAGGGGAQPSALSSETREDLEKAQQGQSGSSHGQTDTDIGASDHARQDEQADYGTPRGPSATGSDNQAGENITPTGADTGAVVNGLAEDRDIPQPEQQRHANSEGAWASGADTRPELDKKDGDEDDDEDRAIGMNGE